MGPEQQPAAPVTSLPPLYARWMDDLLGGPVPQETKATCDDCAMCAKAGDEIASADSCFDPSVKWCSIVPELSNFLVGGILAANGDDAVALAGRASIERRISEGVAVTPLGLFQPPVFKLIYNNIDGAFGRSPTLRCPHYVEEAGRCGIWRNRGSTCATWFCKHVRGALAMKFWRGSLEPLLRTIEKDLGQWCVLQLGLAGEVLHQLFNETQADSLTKEHLENRRDPELQRRLWGEWFGRERDFFIECNRLVAPLSWEETLDICSPEVSIYAELARLAYEKLLANEIAPALKVGCVQLVQVTSSVSRVRTYSPYDPIDVPAEVMELLRYFDGRPTAGALNAIASEKGTRLDPRLIQKLCDFELLVPADGLPRQKASPG
jgi:hypothetical protein